MFKWLRQIKQKRKIKRKIQYIKNYLFFIDRINLLIEKIESLKIKIIKITIYTQDIDFIDYNLESGRKKQFETKKEAIIFLKNSREFYEQQITKIKLKYEKSIFFLNELQSTNYLKKMLPILDLTSTITLKNKNGLLTKFNLNNQIESINTNMFIEESDSDSSTTEQMETTTLISYIYYDSTPSQSQKELNFSITESNKVNIVTTKKQNPETNIKNLTSKNNEFVI